MATLVRLTLGFNEFMRIVSLLSTEKKVANFSVNGGRRRMASCGVARLTEMNLDLELNRHVSEVISIKFQFTESNEMFQVPMEHRSLA
jgi:hypothetical protein